MDNNKLILVTDSSNMFPIATPSNDVNVVKKNALQQAAKAANWKTVDLLLSQGVDDETLCFPEMINHCGTIFLLGLPDWEYDKYKDFDIWDFIHVSACHGHLNIVKSWLKKHSQSLNKTDKLGQTALYWAAAAGKKEIVAYLLEQGAHATLLIDSAINGVQGKTPLQGASENGYTEIISMLQNAEVTLPDAEVTLPDTSISSAKTEIKSDELALMHRAAQSGDLNIVKQLLKKNPALLNKIDNLGQTALLHAVTNISLKVVNYLLAQNDILINLPSSNNQTALQKAAEARNWHVVNVLLGRGADDEAFCFPTTVNQPSTMFLRVRRDLDYSDAAAFERWDFLHISAYEGYLNIVKSWLKKHPHSLNKTDDLGQTALYWAAAAGNKDIVAYLLEQGADATLLIDVSIKGVRGKTPLDGAVENNHIEIVEILQSDVQAKTQDFYSAAKSGSITDISSLLEKNSSLLNKTDILGQTALFYASSQGHKELVQYLIFQGADIDLLEYRLAQSAGNAPIQGATYAGYKDIVIMLIEAGAIYDELELMHLAAHTGQLPIVTYFLEKNKSLLEKKDQYDQTALLLAVEGGQKIVVEYLLEQGASIYTFLPDHPDYGKPFSQYAKDLGHIEIANILQDREPRWISSVGSSITSLFSHSMFAGPSTKTHEPSLLDESKLLSDSEPFNHNLKTKKYI